MNDAPLPSDPLPAACAASPGDAPASLPGRLLDALDLGVLVLEADGRVRYASRPAREALEDGDVVRMRDGRLAMHGPGAQRALERALAEAAGGASRMLCAGDGVPSAKLALSPWGTAPDGTPLLLGTLQTGERDDWPALRVFARERRLTAGETDVLGQLVLGERPPQIAARRGSSEGTVRSQIKSLLEKTGTHSMRELVVEVLHLPPMPAASGGGRPARAPRSDAARYPQVVPRAPSAAKPGAVPVPIRPRVGPVARDGGGDRAGERAERLGLALRGGGDERDVQVSSTGARCLRTDRPMDRAALLALAASPFAWPPAA